MNQELIDFIRSNEKDIVDSFPEFETILKDPGFETANFAPILIEGPPRIVGFYNGQEMKYKGETMTLISFLYIAPSYRKKGFARSTMKYLQTTLRTGLITFANNKSYNIFKGLGFKKIERITKMVWQNGNNRISDNS